jgi:outer membrane lipoprotein-sorting protein
MNIFRRLPLSRLLLLCGLVVVIGISATALASALGGGPVPPAKPLAQAIHDALKGPSVEGVSARVTLTNRLLEGASLASGSGKGGELTSNPLMTGGSGRLWISNNGEVRLELQSEQGDTEIIYDGHTLTAYDASTNTVYRYTPSAGEGGAGANGQGWISQSPKPTGSTGQQPPSLARIEEAIAHLDKHARVSGAQPTDVGGQPAYTVRISPDEGGSVIAGAELSFDAVHGFPLRAAIYSTESSSPVIELAADEVSYGPVASSIFNISPPANAKVEELSGSGSKAATPGKHAGSADRPKARSQGSGISSISVIEDRSSAKSQTIEGLPKVSINGTSASELKTELGTILTFERSGIRYVLAGAVTPSAVEALARGL